MCIAIAKMPHIDLPSKDTFENCFINNSDGCGFSFAHNGKVIIKKGYMQFEDFYKALMEMDKKYNLKDLGCLFHFRIATHGARDGSMTHPFPIISDECALKKIEYVSDYAIVHNGVISLTTSSCTKTDGLSDTATFIKDYLSKIAQNKNWFKKKCNIELIEKMIDSKMAILDKYGNIKMTSGFVCDGGVWYSNTSYKDNYSRYYTKKYDFKSYPYSYHNYYYDDYYDTYDDYYTNKMDKKDNAPIDDLKTPLMKLEDGWTISCGAYDEIVDDKGSKCMYYIDNNSNIYWTPLELDDDETEDDREYFFVGNGIVYDKFNKQVTFKKDIYVYNDQIDYEDVYIK